MQSGFTGGYDDLWKAIIRPPKDEYTLSDLGPQDFKIGDKLIHRTDLKLKNKRGFTLECSFFEPVKRVSVSLPCVIYLHGNSSSRCEALPAVDLLLPSNITLFCLDFSGCGLSQGDYISLGWYERDDVEVVIDYLRSTGKVSAIGLWGRSMGAVTSLMHADRDPTIAGMVLDSPFQDLRLLAEELASSHTSLPKFILNGALALVRNSIKSRAKFDINDLVPMKHVTSGFIPALFVAGKQDTFIKPHHTKNLYEKYSGDKNIIMVDGDHNSNRPQFLNDSVAIFFYNTLQCDQLPKDEKTVSQSGKNFEKLHNGLKVGNQQEVIDAFVDFDEDELERAIQESMKSLNVQVGELNAAVSEVEKVKAENANNEKKDENGDNKQEKLKQD